MRIFSMRCGVGSSQGLGNLLLMLLMPSLVGAQEPSRAGAAACLAYAAVLHHSPVLVSPAKPTPRVNPITEPTTYQEAYSLYKTEQRPMVVMVTASWCPHCPAMKRELLQLKRDGKLAGVSVVIVDHDRDHVIARSVMRERRTLPALSVYQYVDGIAKESRPQRAGEISEVLRSGLETKTTLRTSAY